MVFQTAIFRFEQAGLRRLVGIGNGSMCLLWHMILRKGQAVIFVAKRQVLGYYPESFFTSTDPCYSEK